MTTQISLIITSFMLATAAGIGIFFYLRSKPKKINFLVLLFILSLLPVVSIFRPGSYESSDLSAHVTFAISFFKALTDGSFIPRWGMDLNYTYGYPAFIFIYLLPYYFISILHFLGIPFLLTTKLILALSFIGSGVTMYYFAKDELGELGGFIAGIFYLYAPYHLVDLHFRVDIGEIVALLFLPLLFIRVKKLFRNGSFVNGIFLAGAFSALILSHPAISLASIPLIFIYIFYLVKTAKNIEIKSVLMVFLSLLAGILLTTFYWFPIFVEGKFTSVFLHGYHMLFPNILSFIISPNYFGFLYQGHKGELVFPLGFVQLIIILLIPIILKRKIFTSKQRFLLVLMSAVFILYFFLMQKISEPLWYIIPLIKNFQFSYRLMGIIIFCISIIAGIVLPKIRNKKILVLILIIVILSTILNWGNRKNVPSLNENFLIQHVAQSDSNYAVMGQGVPIWADKGLTRPWILSFPKRHLEIVSGSASITETSRKTTQHTYVVNASTSVVLQENTWYYPGWILFDNGKQIPIQITSGMYPGMVRFILPKGNHKIDFTFIDTWDRNIGNTVSLITLGVIGITLLINFAFHDQKLYGMKKGK